VKQRSETDGLTLPSVRITWKSEYAGPPHLFGSPSLCKNRGVRGGPP